MVRANRFAPALLALLVPLAARADVPPSEVPPAPAPAAEPAPEFNWKAGPEQIALGHELELALPEGYVFLGMPQAGALMTKLGSFHHENLLGVAASSNENDDFIVVIRYDEEGFIKDDEKIDAKELLDTIKEGQEEANKERKERGFSELNIDGWSEPPRYEKEVHHLVWALLVSDPEGKSVNFNTRVLGRRGYVSLNLVTGPEKLDAHKPHAAKLLAATTFKEGSRYQDFNKDTDKVAEYGLMGLILGGAGFGAAKVAKLGILAKFGKFFLLLLAKGGKLIVVLFIGLFAALGKLFGRNKGGGEPPADTGAGTDTTAGNDAPPPPSTPAA